MLEWTIVATSECSLPTHLPVVEIELCLRMGIRASSVKKGLAPVSFPFLLPTKTIIPKIILTCSRGRINPDRQPSRCDGTAPFAFGIFILRWNSLQYRFCIACRIFEYFSRYILSRICSAGWWNSFACIYDDIFRDNRFVSFTVL